MAAIIPEKRLWDKVEPTGFCWNWIGSTSKDGYGKASYKRGGRWASSGAHRVVYMVLVGEIERGLTLDHLCRNTGCVNPDHLDPVTQAVNNSRGFAPTVTSYREGVCRKGHPLDGKYPKNGQSFCKTCRTERQRAYQAQEVRVHGTSFSYNMNRCRCVDCLAWSSAYTASRKDML